MGNACMFLQSNPEGTQAQLNRADALLRTALSYAAQHGHAAVVAALLAAGASMQTPSDGRQAPLSVAAWEGQTGVVCFIHIPTLILSALDALCFAMTRLCQAQRNRD